jgi:hypothetical protein
MIDPDLAFYTYPNTDVIPFHEKSVKQLKDWDRAFKDFIQANKISSAIEKSGVVHYLKCNILWHISLLTEPFLRQKMIG